MTITEGRAAVAESDEVFFNPAMALNRDVTVAALRAHAGRRGVDDAAGDAPSYADAMGATGIRGIRAALETDYRVAINDRSTDAVEAIRRNLERNGLRPVDDAASGVASAGVEAGGDGAGRRVAVTREDANVFLHSNRFDVVDLDPFGSPIPFADAGAQAARELLCVTATDTAPLCGAHGSGVRRYSAVPLNTEYHAEMGLRVLVGAMVRTAARYDVAATPVLSFAERHYARTFLALEDRATAADAALEGLGHVAHCRDCLRRTEHPGLIFDGDRGCPRCGAERDVAGPLWLDPVHDDGFLEATRREIDEGMDEGKRAGKVLRRLGGEIDTATHYDHHVICDRLEVGAGPIDDVLDALHDRGHAASRAHESGTALKTDATIEEIEEIVASQGS